MKDITKYVVLNISFLFIYYRTFFLYTQIRNTSNAKNNTTEINSILRRHFYNCFNIISYSQSVSIIF